MKPHGRGVNGYRPYRRFSSHEILAAARYDLDRAIKRAEANSKLRQSEPHNVSEPQEKKS